MLRAYQRMLCKHALEVHRRFPPLLHVQQPLIYRPHVRICVADACLCMQRMQQSQQRQHQRWRSRHQPKQRLTLQTQHQRHCQQQPERCQQQLELCQQQPEHYPAGLRQIEKGI